MKTVLVTGATGFVGSHALAALDGAPDLNAVAACRDPARLAPDFTGEIRMGDLRDASYRQDVVGGVDVICHAAAWTSAWGHKNASRAEFLAPGLALADAAVAAGVQRFVFLSSTSVAAPGASGDPMSQADPRRLRHWPHLQNVARIEAHLRALAARAATEMTVLRVGLFAGRRFGIGMLPLLVPRLRTHLVPWVAGGRTGLPIVFGDDIGQAFARAAAARALPGYQGFNIIGPETPSAHEVITHLARNYGLPRPHFSVPFRVAYGFGRAMEMLDPLVPWPPLVTRSIVHLLEETGADNARAHDVLGYVPETGWREAIAVQMAEMAGADAGAMPMARPIVP